MGASVPQSVVSGPASNSAPARTALRYGSGDVIHVMVQDDPVGRAPRHHGIPRQHDPQPTGVKLAEVRVVGSNPPPVRLGKQPGRSRDIVHLHVNCGNAH
jgi:hypothetical protein